MKRNFEAFYSHEKGYDYAVLTIEIQKVVSGCVVFVECRDFVLHLN